ncbi:MAG: DUF2442 domain-containing protein [Alphaproteobacteria bacterium]|nr:DUF2442 domain-containing protein [Alphaproteobacteria bacterium]
MNEGEIAYPARIRRDKEGFWQVRFRDLPDALTDGATEAEARTEAADCLAEALAARIVAGEEIPAPSPLLPDEYLFVPDTTLALKAALHSVRLGRGITVAEMARRIGVDHKEARRMLDPAHPTKASTLEHALARLDIVVMVSFHDASKATHILRAPRKGKAAGGSDTPPRIATLSVDDQVGARLILTWNDGWRARVDLSDMIARHEILSPLGKPETFARAAIIGRGTGVGWPGEIDLSAQSLRALAEEQQSTASAAPRPLTRRASP